VRPGPSFRMPINRDNRPNKSREQRAGSGRPVERQLADKLALSSESNVEDAATAVPLSSSPEAQVSFFITQAQTAHLRERGYSDKQIAQMKPPEAQKILGLE
jgi:hypothetical protein